MKKKNNPNQRQENLIKYLNEHDEVTTEEIKNKFDIAKSTLSEDIKFLRSKGYPIATRYGYISLEKQKNKDAIPYYEKLCPSIIRKWMILYTINLFFDQNDNPPNLPSLYEECKAMYSKLTDIETAMSKQVFHKDIRELIQDGYLEYSEATKDLLSDYKCIKNREKELIPTNKTPKAVVLDQQTAYDLFYFLENETASVIYADLKNRLIKQWPNIFGSLLYNKENLYIRSIPDMLEHYMRTPYKSNCLNITCLSENNNSPNLVYKEFETGNIIYSTEKSKFYILGKSRVDESDEKKYCLLPVEHIIDIEEISIPNKLYDEFGIYLADYMFGATLDDSSLNPTKVRVAFIATPDNKLRLRTLKNNRFHMNLDASTDPIKDISFDPDKLIEYGIIEYIDTIIGKSEFLQFVFSFGNEAQVLSPANLVEDICQEKLKWKKRYEESFQLEYEENINECLS